jgi:hypothetical protein
MADKGGRPTSSGGTHSFQITISKAAFRYLGYLAKETNMGGSENGVAAFVLSRELERMRLSGDYRKDIPVAEEEDPRGPKGAASGL